MIFKWNKSNSTLKKKYFNAIWCEIHLINPSTLQVLINMSLLCPSTVHHPNEYYTKFEFIKYVTTDCTGNFLSTLIENKMSYYFYFLSIFFVQNRTQLEKVRIWLWGCHLFSCREQANDDNNYNKNNNKKLNQQKIYIF